MRTHGNHGHSHQRVTQKQGATSCWLLLCRLSLLTYIFPVRTTEWMWWAFWCTSCAQNILRSLHLGLKLFSLWAMCYLCKWPTSPGSYDISRSSRRLVTLNIILSSRPWMDSSWRDVFPFSSNYTFSLLVHSGQIALIIQRSLGHSTTDHRGLPS